MVANLDPADVEAGLLHAIESGDVGSRAVYADWLEARDDLERAEFLRLLDRIAAEPPYTAHYTTLIADLGDRCRDLDLAWRRIVARDVGEQLFEGIQALVTPRRPRGEWQLPAQLRYLEDLAPEPTFDPPATIATLAPNVRHDLDVSESTLTGLVASLLAAVRKRLD